MRKVKLIIGLILIVCIMATSFGCKASKKEVIKFVGRLSSEAYDSMEDAAKSYYEEQIKSEHCEDCEFKGYTSKKALSKNEIGELELGTLETSDVISAERGKVGFVYGSEVFSNSVYMIQTENGYYYYTVEPKEEEAVCKDYYEHLVSEEVLKNVTVKTSAMIICEEDGYSRQTDVMIEYCYNEKDIMFTVVVKRFFNGGISEATLSGYIMTNGEEFAVYGLNEKGEYVDITTEYLSLFYASKRNDPYMVNVMSNLYKEGHYLFKADEDAFILRGVEVENLSRLFESQYYEENGGTVKVLDYSMVVSGQRIVSTSINIHSIDSEEIQTSYISIDSTFSKYGETEVEVPAEVLALWQER